MKNVTKISIENFFLNILQDILYQIIYFFEIRIFQWMRSEWLNEQVLTTFSIIYIPVALPLRWTTLKITYLKWFISLLQWFTVTRYLQNTRIPIINSHLTEGLYTFTSWYFKLFHISSIGFKLWDKVRVVPWFNVFLNKSYCYFYLKAPDISLCLIWH